MDKYVYFKANGLDYRRGGEAFPRSGFSGPSTDRKDDLAASYLSKPSLRHTRQTSSAAELRDAALVGTDTSAILSLIGRGGFPELWEKPEMPAHLYLDSYIATYLERDVKQVLAVGNLRDFERFLRACALRSAQQLNKSDLARDVGISVPTASQWLSVLEALGQVYLLEPWFGNLNKRLAKSPKLYLSDPALMAHLIGLRADSIESSPFAGAIWETLVLSEIRKQQMFAGQRPKIWYYRDQSQNEVDFIREDGASLHIYECKWTRTPTRDMGKNLDKFETILQSAKSLHQVASKTLITRSGNSLELSGLGFRGLSDSLI